MTVAGLLGSDHISEYGRLQDRKLYTDHLKSFLALELEYIFLKKSGLNLMNVHDKIAI